MELTATGVATGGDAIARDDDGRVVFVAGALPGERVKVEVTSAKRDFAKAVVVEVLDPSADRIAPPCPHYEEGCGGCDWQFVDPRAQSRLKADIVIDNLTRIGRLEHVPSPRITRVPDADYRTTLRLAVLPDGRAGLRRRHSHDVVPLDSCVISHPLVEGVLAGSCFTGAREVTIRVGARTGDRLVVGPPRREKVRVPEGVTLVATHHLQHGQQRFAITEEAAGRTWRVSPQSFFQSGPEAADALVDAVDRAVADLLDATADPMVLDAYCGVGLLGGGLAQRHPGLRVVGVEANPAAVADAQHNLADLAPSIVRGDVADLVPPAEGQPGPTVVVADPAREGLGPEAAKALAALDADRLVLVSCDAASLGRDARLLHGLGYRLHDVQVLDLFPHTTHVEAVTRFDRKRTVSG